MRALRSRGSWDTLEKHNERIARLDLQLELFVKRFDQSEASWKEERREMEARVAADRAATEARLAADRKETAERLAVDRKEAAERLAAELKETKQEFAAQKRWLITIFFTIVFGMSGLIASYILL